MAISYLNTRLYGQVETLDELDSKTFADWRALRAEKARLLHEYAISGHGSPYWSSRPTKSWTK